MKTTHPHDRGGSPALLVRLTCLAAFLILAGCGGNEAEPDPGEAGGGEDPGTILLDLYVTESPRVQPGDVVDLVRLVAAEGTDGLVVPAVKVVSTDWGDDGDPTKGNVVVRMEEKFVDALDEQEGSAELTLRRRDENAP